MRPVLVLTDLLIKSESEDSPMTAKTVGTAWDSMEIHNETGMRMTGVVFPDLGGLIVGRMTC